MLTFASDGRIQCSNCVYVWTPAVGGQLPTRCVSCQHVRARGERAAAIRRTLVALKQRGALDRKDAISRVAEHFGVTRQRVHQLAGEVRNADE